MRKLIFLLLAAISLAGYSQDTTSIGTAVFVERDTSGIASKTVLSDTGSGWAPRVINYTEKADTPKITITGDSILLQTGKYFFSATAALDVTPGLATNGSVGSLLRIRNITDGVTLLAGAGQKSAIYPYKSRNYIPLKVEGYYANVTKPIYIQLQQYVSPGTTLTFTPGQPVGSGEYEIYSRFVVQIVNK